MEPDQKEQWIAKTLTGLAGMQRAEPPTDLAEKVAQRLAGADPHLLRARLYPVPHMAWRMAACMVFILAINIFTCLQFGRSSQATAGQAADFAQAYFDLTPVFPL